MTNSISFSATNAGLAAALSISERRVAAIRAEGKLPMTSSGERIDTRAMLQAGWLASLSGGGGGGDKGAEEAFRHAVAAILKCAAAELPIAVALAAGETGLQRADVERLANMTLLLWATIMNELGEAAGLPEIELPDPGGWQAKINWPAGGHGGVIAPPRGVGCP
jgi:hypothetical protein